MIEKNIERTFSLKTAIQCFLYNFKKQKIKNKFNKFKQRGNKFRKPMIFSCF